MKKIMLVFVSLLMIILLGSTISLNADDQLYLSDGTAMYYKGTDNPVYIASDFVMQDTYYRGCWITPLAGGLPSCSDSSIENYKKEIKEMFDVMEYFNLNALIFHIRIMNDALYPSELNPKSNYMSTSQDLLPWVIEECHKRGIEFHAWLNPYRVKSSGGSTATEEAQKIKNRCPANVGSDPNNLLVNSSGGVILNPGEPAVRDFIVDTCMEVIEKYDVDAIHFDDYFYITGVDDSATRAKYNPDDMELGDWRRHQVDLFIEQLSNEMRAYNRAHNRYVQLGISPSGIYRNGDGKVSYDEDGNAITNGSKTGGMEHYGNYLYSDTVNWINHEWIDYIMPQSYWAFSQPIAGFADVMSWWDKVCAKKKVNLYSGMGIYMSETPGRNYSWGFDPNEAPNQILYTQTLSHTQGTVFYSYNYLESGIRDKTTLFGQGLDKIKQKMFKSPAILPVIRTMDHVDISPVSDISINNENGTNTISFSKVNGAKFYVIYRSRTSVELKPDEVIAIIGDNGDTSTKMTFEDNVGNNKYNYAIRVQAGNNELSEAKFVGSSKYKVEFTDFDGNVIDTQYVYYGNSAVAPTPPTRSSEFKGWGTDYTYITGDTVVNAKYQDSTCHIKFLMDDDTLIKEIDVPYGSNAEIEAPEKEGYDFVSWTVSIENVTKDMETKAVFTEKILHMQFLDADGYVIEEYDIKYGNNLRFPANPEKRGYEFVGWSPNSRVAKHDTMFTPIFEPIYYTLTLINKIDDSVIGEVKVQAYTDAVLPEPPEVRGYTFKYWLGTYTDVRYDNKIYAYYDENCYNITIYDENGEVVEVIEHYFLDDFIYPEPKEIEGLEFLRWSFDINDLGNDDFDIDMYPVYFKRGVKIKFAVDGGQEISTITLNDKNTEIVYPVAPTIEGKRFLKWSLEVGDIISLDKDIEIKAIYEDVILTITYLDKDGKRIAEENVKYGDSAKHDFEIPTIDGFKFKGFSASLDNIKEDMEVSLVYEEAKKGCNKGAIVNALFSVFTAFGTLFILKKKH